MMKVKTLIEHLGQTYSERLGIDLQSKQPGEIFKWFLASILFGARITETIAINTYKRFEEDGLLSPDSILKAGWDDLVASLDEGGYVRYDFKTADMLLGIAQKMKKEYDGNLIRLHDISESPEDLERRLKEFKGIGDVTVGIFLRELRGIWEKANPLPGRFAILAAKNLGFTRFEGKGREEKTRILEDLLAVWSRERVRGRSFSHLESALVRLGKDFCNKRKCDGCDMIRHCIASRGLGGPSKRETASHPSACGLSSLPLS